MITPQRDVAHIYTDAGGAWVRAGTFDTDAAVSVSGPPHGADTAPQQRPRRQRPRSRSRADPLLLSAWAPDALNLAIAAGDGQVFLLNRSAHRRHSPSLSQAPHVQPVVCSVEPPTAELSA